VGKLYPKKVECGSGGMTSSFGISPSIRKQKIPDITATPVLRGGSQELIIKGGA